MENLLNDRSLVPDDEPARALECIYPNRPIQVQSLFGVLTLMRNYYFHQMAKTGRCPLVLWIISWIWCGETRRGWLDSFAVLPQLLFPMKRLSQKVTILGVCANVIRPRFSRQPLRACL